LLIVIQLKTTIQKTTKLSESMKKNLLPIFILLLVIGVSCVPARKFNDLEARYTELTADNLQLLKENESAYALNNELSHRISGLEHQISMLRADTTQLGREMRDLHKKHHSLSQSYEALLVQNTGRSEEIRQILTRLQATQEDLQVREDQLRYATQELNEKEKNLNILMDEVRRKELRVAELENILARQDSAVQALRRTVSTALLGFENNGLTIEIKQGKVYVSLEESLLFASGSANVDTRGESALKELAKVLERNPEINVLIEGHTDNVPLRGTGQIRDNWDLSVVRATAIVRILLKHGNIDPRRLTAAGKGEFLPLDAANTAEARRKNRRTEIILTPRLDELFQILEVN
jgi:chemotaxis protein MotB